MAVFIYIWMLIVHFQPEVLSQCTLPTQFQNSVWVDSDKGELVFDTVNMTGWDFQADGGDTRYEDWQCFHTSTVGTKLYLIMINTQNVIFLSGEFTPYLCMELTEITTQSYYYYLLWAEEEKYRYERINGKTSTTVVSDPVGELCLDSAIATEAAQYPETGEYHVLIKKGNELAAKQECPSTFFGEYSYKVTNIATNTDNCGLGNETWDVCTDYGQMTFNYTICSTPISYSANGSVYCVSSITSGNYTYHTLYNEDNTVDISSETYRFTCMMSVISSDGSLNVSQTPGSCKKSQTPTSQPVFAYNGSVAGLNLQLTPRRLCPKTDNVTSTTVSTEISTESSSGISTGATVGIVFGILIFIAAIILLCLLCIRFKGRQPKKKEEQPDKTPVTSPRSDKLSVDIDDIPHQRSPLWIHGPHGTAPMETKFSGDHKISKSPTLDHKFNPFSVLQLGKGKEIRGEENPNRGSQSPLKLSDRETNKEPLTVLKQEEMVKTDYFPEKKKETNAIENTHSGRLFIEDLEKPDNNKIIPARPGAFPVEKRGSSSPMTELLPKHTDPESVKSLQTEPNGVISRNSNVTPKAIVLETLGFEDDTQYIQDLKGQSPVKDTKEQRSGLKKRSEEELGGPDKEVAALSRSSYIHNILDKQVRQSPLTPVLITEKTSRTEPSKPTGTASKKSIPLTENSLPDNHKIIKTHFKREDLKYAANFLQMPKTPTPGPNDERSFKGRKKNKVVARSQGSVPKADKLKKPPKVTQTFKVKSKPNKRGNQALGSLVKSKYVGVSKNKKGTFYNEDIPTVTEPETYLNVSQLDSTINGICYDDDNEKARALCYWNNDSLVTNVTDKSGNHNHSNPNELKLALGTTDNRSISRHTLNTDMSLRESVSARSLSAITSRIDSRGAKYFIENESSSIAIHVKPSDVPDDLEITHFVGGSNVNNIRETDDQESEVYKDNEVDDDEVENEDEDEDEDEDEEEDIEDFDESREDNRDEVETTMSVLYGTSHDEEDDPDRMVLKGYEHNLLTIKE